MVNKSLFMIALVFSLSAFADEKYDDKRIQELKYNEKYIQKVQEIELIYERSCLEGKDFFMTMAIDGTKIKIPALRSCYIVGFDHFFGDIGIPKDRAKAKGIRFLHMACDNMTVSNFDKFALKSCELLGRIYYCGDEETPWMVGVEFGGIASKYNKEQALKYFSKACDLGDSKSCDLKIAVMNDAGCSHNGDSY